MAKPTKPEETKFTGFPKKTLTFLRQLKKNNNKEWFQSHRDDYEENIMAPSRAFATAMGQHLTKIAPHIIADPRVNGSLFRINRDTRFSKDKTPYKTHMGIFFWEGHTKKMESPGFYFHLDPNALMVGVGMYMFPKHVLPIYRDAVIDKKLGPELHKAIQKVGSVSFGRTGCGMPVDKYKKVPTGFDPHHPRAEYLKFKGLHAGLEHKHPPELHSPKLLTYCMQRFRKLAPLHHWLVKMNHRVK